MISKTTIATTVLLFFFGILATSFAANEHSMQHHHGSHNKSSLKEAGNGAFGTLQEVLQQLLADPKTDWSKVNMEALRQHLVDMDNFTLNIEVLTQTRIKNGLVVVLTPNNHRVKQSLDRVFTAHPAQLKIETGWDMKTQYRNKQYTITITTSNQKDIQKIQGLGYIGVMTWGNHHPMHHWMMATGGNPH